MTKRILAMALVVVFACLALASCDKAPATTTPATETPKTEAPATTKPADKTDVPATTPNNGGDETAVPTEPNGETPVPTEPAGWDMFEQFGGIDKLYSSGHFYGTAFETWPFEDNGTWCARAFFQSCVIINKEDGNFKENLGTDDYEYTFKWYWHDAEITPEKQEDLKGPFTSPIETCYDFDSAADDANVIYRLQVGSAPEGDMCKDLVRDGTYMFLIAVYKGDTCLGFVYTSQVWTPLYDSYYKVYNNFWTAHDRSEGYASGMQTVTAADIQDAADNGFDEKGAFSG
jgi:hypothetical protein